MKVIQWDVVWSVLRTLLVGGGPVATLLIALDFPPVQVGKWMGIGLAGVGVLSVAIPGLKAAFNRTDSSKVAAAAALTPEAVARVAEKQPETVAKVAEVLPDEVKIVAVAAIPEVTAVIAAPTANNGVAKLASDPNQPKIIMQPHDPQAGS